MKTGKKEQFEQLNRGLIAIKVNNGVFLSWRLLRDEVSGYCETGLTGADFIVYRNGQEIAQVTDSTNYLDADGHAQDQYYVMSTKGSKSDSVTPLDANYIDIPISKPVGGVTPAGESYEYSANDMSVGDVDGDGEYEYFVKWDPSNAHDVSHRGYTGKQYIDCYKLDGRLLWRLDMGVNIRSGAHYTQFMVYDFNGDGRAEIAVKTAPGTKMTVYDEHGQVQKSFYISLPPDSTAAGVTNLDNYVCSAKDYYEHIVETFKNWPNHPEVKARHWPQTLEECFEIPVIYHYPLSDKNAWELADFFFDVYAPARSPKNELRKFEGFIYEGPEYLTMFSGLGDELETIDFKFARDDDGLMWGDYGFKRIEPCNRVDRFLSGVAYLDGKRPYLIICRGYYTRTTIVAYDFFDNHFREAWSIDSGYVPLSNPFNDDSPHGEKGTDPVYGCIAGQGNHSLSCCDVDGDGCMEIIYGAACIDHDGSVLYSSYDKRHDGVIAKLGHGDSMHVGRFDSDSDEYYIFNVFEGASAVPYGFALREARTGKVLFGEPADSDLGRCMAAKIDPNVKGYQFWVKDIVYDLKGNPLPDKALSTNMRILFSADLMSQVTDGVNYLTDKSSGVVNDNVHGIMLKPNDTLTNNGTKGNPCLVADLFGDFREEIALRLSDSSAIRIYTNTEITDHKLFTLMQDTQYRCGIAWQNNCYNQPVLPKFYYGPDMSFAKVLETIGH